MKKLLKLVSAVICVICLFSVQAFAEDYTHYADELKRLGLFRGTDVGYELDKTLTRAESAAMLVRLLGGEITASTAQYTEKFSDVTSDKWHFHYIMYCYENDITKGTSEDMFSPDDTITAEQFVTLLLRALGYTDTEPENAFLTANKIGLFGTQFSTQLEESEEFLRNEMVYIAYRSLKTMTADGEVLAARLSKTGVLTQSQVKEFDIYEFEDFDDFLDAYFE